MVVYLTYNDQPSGVYGSQVCDVVEYLSAHGSEKVQLVAFVSLRGFGASRRKIKALSPSACVVPMFPRMKNWRVNTISLWFILLWMRPRVVMARGVFATKLALRARKMLKKFKLVFDARGAYYAEFSEYQLSDSIEMIETVKRLEDEVLRQSDAQLAVSNALVNYWKTQYNLDLSATAEIIPCTLSHAAQHALQPASSRQESRRALNVTDDEVLLVYSGSAAGWQSFTGLFDWLLQLMRAKPRVKLLLMTPVDTLANTPLAEMAERVILRWVSPQEVSQYLNMGDYGLLLREDSVTNQVASPTKFAEYLAAGLHVLISPDLGDFPGFVEKHQCGMVIQPGSFPEFNVATPEEMARMNTLALAHFSKSGYLQAYARLLK